MEDIIKELSKYPTSVLKEEVFRRRKKEDKISNEKIIKTVCEYYKVTVKQVMKKGKGAGNNSCRKAKSVLYYIFRYIKKKSTKEIASIMNKNHSTVSITSRDLKAKLDIYPNLNNEVNYLIKLIKQ